MRRKYSVFFTLLILSSLFVSIIRAPDMLTASTTTVDPKRPANSHLAPPSNITGSGFSMTLTDSVNGWMAFPGLLAKNTFPYGNVSKRETSFSNSPPPLAWQQITVSSITATMDFRPVQGGNTTNDYFKANNELATWKRLAMRFTVNEKVNLTSVWLYYRLSGPMANTVPLTIVSDSSNLTTPPPVGGVIGSGLVKGSQGVADWYVIPLTAPVTLTTGMFYWVVVDASLVPGPAQEFDWYVKYDAGDNQDGLFTSAIAGVGGWKDEATLWNQIGGHFFNFLLVLSVLPVTSSGNEPRSYNSPALVNMYLNGTTPITANTTRVSNSYRTFVLSTNTSVTFTANWTARFESLFINGVTTHYIARQGFTLWNATFTSDNKPDNPYTWYNKTFKVAPIPPFWNGTSHPPTIWNNRTYISSFTNGSGYYLISQISNISDAWNSDWRISVKSVYAITVSVPSKAIAGCAFNLTISAPLANSNVTINVYNSTDSLVNSTVIHIGSSTVYSLKLNKSDNYNITFFDTYDLENEASFVTSEINVVRASTAINLASPIIDATWGDMIALSVRYRNATDGANATFPSSPMPAFRIGSIVVTGVTPLAGGWYDFNYSTRNLPSAGIHLLTINASYNGAYLNQTAFTLNLTKIPMTLGIVIGQTSVAAGSFLVVSAQLNYGNGTLVDNTFNVTFDFLITLMNGSVATVTSIKPIYGGVATASLLATSDMKSINVNVTYAGTPTLGSTNDYRLDILVTLPPPFPIMAVILAGGGTGALIIGAIVAARVRSRRRLREEAKALVLRQTASLASLIVVHLASGRNVFSRSLGTEEAVDPNLISGFLSANQSILQEVFQKKTGAGLRFADYGEYKVVSHLGKYVMATLFCTEAAGEELRSVLEQFSEKFEKKYSKTLETWDGEMDAFKDADTVADEYFNLPLCSPYVVVGEDFAHRRLSGDERKVIEEAQRLSAGRGFFFITLIIDFLLTKQGVKRSKTVELIRSLTNRGIFKQLTVDEAAELGRAQQEANTQP